MSIDHEGWQDAAHSAGCVCGAPTSFRSCCGTKTTSATGRALDHSLESAAFTYLSRALERETGVWGSSLTYVAALYSDWGVDYALQDSAMQYFLLGYAVASSHSFGAGQVQLRQLATTPGPGVRALSGLQKATTGIWRVAPRKDGGWSVTPLGPFAEESFAVGSAMAWGRLGSGGVFAGMVLRFDDSAVMICGPRVGRRFAARFEELATHLADAPSQRAFWWAIERELITLLAAEYERKATDVYPGYLASETRRLKMPPPLKLVMLDRAGVVALRTRIFHSTYRKAISYMWSAATAEDLVTFAFDTAGIGMDGRVSLPAAQIEAHPLGVLRLPAGLLDRLGLPPNMTIGTAVERLTEQGPDRDALELAVEEHRRQRGWLALMSRDDAEPYTLYQDLMAGLVKLFDPEIFEVPFDSLALTTGTRRRFQRAWSAKHEPLETVGDLPARRGPLYGLVGIAKGTVSGLNKAIRTLAEEWPWRRAGIDRDANKEGDVDARKLIGEGLDELAALFEAEMND